MATHKLSILIEALGTATAARNIQGMSRAISGVGRELQSYGRSMTTGLTLPIIGAGAAIVKVGADFDTSLRQITALTDATSQETDALKGKILDLANAVGKDPEQLAQGYYFLRSAGQDAAASLDILTVSAKASASGMGDVADIAKVIGGSINAYGKENLTASDAADQLLRAIKDGAAEAPDFANALGTVNATAGQMGVSFADTTSAIAAMTLKNIDADTAATNLNQIFTSLLKTTPQSAEGLASVGLSAEGLRKQLREQGLLSVLQTLQTAFEGNDTAAAQVFGNVRALRGVLALTTGDAAQVAAVFNDVANGTANVGEAFKQTDGPGRDLNKAITAIKTTLIDLSSDVMPPVIDALNSGVGVIKGVVAAFKALPAPRPLRHRPARRHRRRPRSVALGAGQVHVGHRQPHRCVYRTADARREAGYEDRRSGWARHPSARPSARRSGASLAQRLSRAPSREPGRPSGSAWPGPSASA